jgi:hypothetical protein
MLSLLIQPCRMGCAMTNRNIIMESLIMVFSREGLFMLLFRENLFIVFTEERLCFQIYMCSV